MQVFADREKPEVILIAEHKLSNKHKFGLRGYNTYTRRRDRIDGSGGEIVICVRKGIEIEKIYVETGRIEGTIVRIRGVDGDPITLMALYLRPRDTLNADDLDTIIGIESGGTLIIGADLNTKHPYCGGSTVNASGRVLNESLISYPDMDIRKTPTSESYINVIITSKDL